MSTLYSFRKKFFFLFLRTTCHLIFFCIFATALVHLQVLCKVIKRESGANPEQSRCCMLFYNVFEQYFCHCLQDNRRRTTDNRANILNCQLSTVNCHLPTGRRSKRERVRRPAMHNMFTAFEDRAKNQYSTFVFKLALLIFLFLAGYLV